MPLAADEVKIYPRRRRYIFSVAHSNCVDAFIAVARCRSYRLNRETAALLGCVAVTVFSHRFRSDTGNHRIRSCPNSPLKIVNLPINAMANCAKHKN